MALLRMLAFRPQGIIDVAEAGIAKKKTELNASPSPRAASLLTEKPIPAPQPVRTATASIPPQSTPTQTTETLSTENWPSLWQRLPLAGVIRNTAAHCSLERIEGENYFFTLDQDQAGLFEASHATRLGDALTTFLGKKHIVHIKTGKPDSTTPQQAQQQKRAQLQKIAEESFRKDPNVQVLIRDFNGSIVEDSIKPFQKSAN